MPMAHLLGSAIKIQSAPGFPFLEQGGLECYHSLSIRFLQLTVSQSSFNNSLTPREFQNSSLLVYVNISLWTTCTSVGDIVFAKSSVPFDQQ